MVEQLNSPEVWRRGKAYSLPLTGEQCPHCSKIIFPRRDICPQCLEEAKQPFTLSGKGIVYSYTTIYQAPAGYEGLVPYTEIIFESLEGPRLTARLTDWGDEPLEIGSPVELVTRKLRDSSDDIGPILYGYTARPRK